MLYTTFDRAKKAGACEASYRRYGKHVGGIARYGRHKPIPLTEIADVLGIEDALWSLDCTQDKEKADLTSQMLAVDFADHVLHIYEETYPDDDRPRKAIEAARLYIQGEISDAAWDAARDAAWAAARDAAWVAARDAARDAERDAARAATRAATRDAARDAAWAAARDAAWAAARDAAWDAEQEWQLKRFKEVVT